MNHAGVAQNASVLLESSTPHTHGVGVKSVKQVRQGQSCGPATARAFWVELRPRRCLEAPQRHHRGLTFSQNGRTPRAQARTRACRAHSRDWDSQTLLGTGDTFPDGGGLKVRVAAGAGAGAGAQQ